MPPTAKSSAGRRPELADTEPETARPQGTSTGTTDDPLGEGTFGRLVTGHPLVLLYANVPALIMPTLHPKIAHVLSEKTGLSTAAKSFRHCKPPAAGC